jgi:hypothetical protein
VPDLEAAMEELTAAAGIQWREPIDRDLGELRWRLVYSIGEVPLIELVEGQPGTAWHSPDGPKLHHIGGFTDDLDQSIEQFEGAGGSIVVDGRALTGRWAYFGLPTSGLVFEVIEADESLRRRVLGQE